MSNTSNPVTRGIAPSGLTGAWSSSISNGAVGNARKWTGPVGSRAAKKPYKITRFSSGREPEGVRRVGVSI